jgi:hypothetical protein
MRDPKQGAASFRIFDLDLAAVPQHDTVDDRKTEPRPALFESSRIDVDHGQAIPPHTQARRRHAGVQLVSHTSIVDLLVFVRNTQAIEVRVHPASHATVVATVYHDVGRIAQRLDAPDEVVPIFPMLESTAVPMSAIARSSRIGSLLLVEPGIGSAVPSRGLSGTAWESLSCAVGLGSEHLSPLCRPQRVASTGPPAHL